MSKDRPRLALPPHPWVAVAVGRRGSGKTYQGIQWIRQWRVTSERAKGLGCVLAVDNVAPEPPTEDYFAGWADYYSQTVPTEEQLAKLGPVGLLAIDEADQYARHRDAEKVPTPFAIDLIRRGRHRNGGVGTSIFLATQRPARLVYDAWGLADAVIICQLTSKHDLDRVCELEGVKPYRERIATTTRPGPVVVWTPAAVYEWEAE